jgi:DNA-binding MarR family transcriptional regulator
VNRSAASPETGAREHKIASRLNSAAVHLLRRLRREDRALGISVARLSALSVVVFGGPLTLGELAAAEDVTPPTITRLVAALEADGLVTRVRDPGDGRVIRVQATAKGKRVMERGRTRRTETLAAQLAGLTEADLDALERAADILDALTEGRRPAGT